MKVKVQDDAVGSALSGDPFSPNAISDVGSTLTVMCYAIHWNECNLTNGATVGERVQIWPYRRSWVITGVLFSLSFNDLIQKESSQTRWFKLMGWFVCFSVIYLYKRISILHIIP